MGWRQRCSVDWRYEFNLAPVADLQYGLEGGAERREERSILLTPSHTHTPSLLGSSSTPTLADMWVP
jgi:hypothetical protein